MLLQTEVLKRVVVLAVATSVAALTGAGCGGDGPTEEQQAAAKVESKVAQIKQNKKTTGVVFVAKPEWDLLVPHFGAFVGRIEEEIHSKAVTWEYKDAFASRLEKFYPPAPTEAKALVDLDKAAKKAAGEAKKKEEEGKSIQSILTGIVAPTGPDDKAGNPEIDTAAVNDPLVKAPLNKYSFRIIMTGVSNPQVLVEDPEGQTHVVLLNDKVGNEGGYVTDILKHKVYVKLPDKEQPLEISLAPDTLPESFTVNAP
jgi:hypothetical protein